MDICDSAINSVLLGQTAFCKFLSANDTGVTGSHQSGIYLPRDVSMPLFGIACIKGQNSDKYIDISWNQHLTTNSRFIYYGTGTRNECRITRFGQGFEYLSANYTGALFVLVKNQDRYQAFALNTEEDIERFLTSFSLSPNETNRLISKSNASLDNLKRQLFIQYINSLPAQDFFPTTKELASAAQHIYFQLHPDKTITSEESDKLILEWLDIEYELFREIESNCFVHYQGSFNNVDTFINIANTFLNRRKSRAGKSLEHHLSFMFSALGLPFSSQGVTEGNKKPDFMFPSIANYHNLAFPTEKLCMLASKTTCKDRWRQILNEANRLRQTEKYLFTLQQGISPQQLKEMACEKVVLVVPKAYINTYPKEFRCKILTLAQFSDYLIKLYKDYKLLTNN